MSRLLPEAREPSVDVKARFPNPLVYSPSQKTAMPNQEGPGEADRAAVSCQKKKLYRKSSLCNEANKVPRFGQKEADTQKSPHVPCLRLIDRAGRSLETPKGREGGKVCLGIPGGQRPPRSVDPLLANALKLLHSIRNVACVAFITRLVDRVYVSNLGCCSSRACAGWEKNSLGRPLKRS